MIYTMFDTVDLKQLNHGRGINFTCGTPHDRRRRSCCEPRDCDIFLMVSLKLKWLLPTVVFLCLSQILTSSTSGSLPKYRFHVAEQLISRLRTFVKCCVCVGSDDISVKRALYFCNLFLQASSLRLNGLTKCNRQQRSIGDGVEVSRTSVTYVYYSRFLVIYRCLE